MRLLLVEDNERLALPLMRGLESSGFAVDGVTTAADASVALETVRYDVAILDLGLPDQDGLSLLRSLRRRGDMTPILVLTARSGLQDRVTGLDAGADDYLVKPFAFEELVARLQALLRRPGTLLGTGLRAGNVTLDTGARQVFVDGTAHLFTAREVSLLEQLMRRSGRVVPKQVLESALYGLGEDIESNALEVHVYRLRKRLADSGATIEIHTLRGVGYLVVEKGA